MCQRTVTLCHPGTDGQASGKHTNTNASSQSQKPSNTDNSDKHAGQALLTELNLVASCFVSFPKPVKDTIRDDVSAETEKKNPFLNVTGLHSLNN